LGSYRFAGDRVTLPHTKWNYNIGSVVSTKLGDMHNFGQCVQKCKDGSVFKPRPTIWEYQLLSSNSFFRQKLHDFYLAGNGLPWSLLPNLQFWKSIDGAEQSGHVEFLVLKPVRVTDSLNINFFEQVGHIIALLSWLGIGDLHKENIGCGYDSDGKIVLAPFDIESIFNNYALPTQTHLIPSAGLSKEKCGLSKVLKLLNSNSGDDLIAVICHGYLKALSFLQLCSKELENTFLSLKSVKKTPIRVFPRSTSDYRRFLISDDIKSCEISDTELEQLKRGDIPYFFRFVGKNDIYYYIDKTKFSSANLPLNLKVQALGEIRTLSKNSFSVRNIDTLKKAGVLQIAKTLIKTKRGVAHYNDLDIQWNHEIKIYQANKIGIKCAI
jgi:lantibiotic modifying enzyme